MSDKGEVFSSRYRRLLKQKTDKDGYKKVKVKRKDFFVHRLVMLAHVPIKQFKMVKHKNLDPADNRLENLFWNTK